MDSQTIQELSVQFIGFLLLFLIMKRIAWRPLLAVLDERRVRIEEEFRQVAQSKAEMVRLQEEYRQRLAKIEDEARMKIQQAILEGKRISVEIQEQAREQSYALMAKSKETVELELKKAKVMLRDELTAITLSAVERILREKLDAEKDRKLVDAVLNELEQDASRA